MFKVHIAPTSNFVITFIRHDLFATRKSASRKKYRVPQDILGKAVYTYVSKRWECVLSCARELAYWLLYHQNRNSMPSCKSDSYKYVCECAWIYIHVRQRTSYSRMLGVIIYKRQRGSERRACRCWRRVVRVYIFRGLVANHWRLSHTISRRTTTNEKRYYRNAAIIKFITWHFYTGFYDYSTWLTVLQVLLMQRTLFIDTIT